MPLIPVGRLVVSNSTFDPLHVFLSPDFTGCDARLAVTKLGQESDKSHILNFPSLFRQRGWVSPKEQCDKNGCLTINVAS
jgi:hypothetical protein